MLQSVFALRSSPLWFNGMSSLEWLAQCRSNRYVASANDLSRAAKAIPATVPISWAVASQHVTAGAHWSPCDACLLRPTKLAGELQAKRRQLR